MNKMTKEIKIKNMYGEIVTIEPIDYNIALQVVELQEKLHNLSESFISRFKTCQEYLKNKAVDPELIKIGEEAKILDDEYQKIRELNNYYYAGISNLEDEDIKRIQDTYNRKWEV